MIQIGRIKDIVMLLVVQTFFVFFSVIGWWDQVG